ncbi:hypothetical protein PMZ80_004098 [Knufia obscura]|uniref:Prion-inhibition and propagation HeLo domain-containing protein n=1 Tax=Knufia obscura TaxID=1635080 RepID=A0ABR0RRA7_9EURO|nr:hypothetical protein PMZ80_004098 [Knufia obscura]
MAELALGSLGLVLAWKGVVDFCTTLAELLQDDEGPRGSLLLRARCIKKSFEDWGEKYGVQNPKGEFASFDDERKELIAEILQRQSDASTKVFRKTLEEYVIGDCALPDCNSLVKQAVGGYRKRIRKSAEKVKWKLVDEKAMTDCIEELDRQSRSLWDLTWTHQSFLRRNNTMAVDQLMAAIKDEFQALRGLLTVHQRLPQDLHTLEVAINASLHTVAPIAVLDRVEHFARRAFLSGTDTNITDQLHAWQAYDEAPFMCVETSADFDDEMSALTSADFYVSMPQPKLIYIRDPVPALSCEAIIIDMLNSLVQQAVQYLTATGKSINFPSSPDGKESVLFDTPDVYSLIQVLQALMLQICVAKQTVLLVVEGLEMVAMTNNRTSDWARLFVQSLRTVNSETRACGGQVRCVCIGPGRGELFNSDDTDVRLLEAMDNCTAF